MGKRKAREDEVAPPPEKSVAVKRRRTTTRGASTSSTSGMCDDVLRSIFARVPSRTAVASMVLSRDHHLLMRCPDFRDLHRRLAPPLPHPHIAYVATAKIRRGGGGGRDHPFSGYLGFHVAGGGSSKSDAPMRSLAGPMYLEKKYINTCNGVVLLAGKPRPSTCVLWNPAVADEEKEVTVPVSDRDDPVMLGLGYGPRTQTYKLLLTRRRKQSAILLSNPPITRYPKELLVYTLGGGSGAEKKKKQPRLRAVSSGEGAAGKFRGQPLYMDGTIYLLDVMKSAVLAFDVDSETVTYIDLPKPRHSASKLMEVSGRPCLDMYDSAGAGSRALWLLTVERQWERRCLITRHYDDNDLYHYSITGVWDCGGVLFVYMHPSLAVPGGGSDDGEGGGDKLYMYRVASKMMSRAKLLYNLSPEGSEYAMCWGYRPTLVSPGSIIGELGQDEEEQRLCTAEIMESLKPLSERDTRKGKKATLDTVCFMEYLVRIMRKLPDNMEDVLKMPLLNSQGAYSRLKYEICCSDSDF